MNREARELKKALYENSEAQTTEPTMDSVELDEAFLDNVASLLATGNYLGTILDAIVTSEDGATFDVVLDNIVTDDMNEDEQEYMLDMVEKTLIYLKVPTVMVDNLTSEDGAISATEMNTLREHVLDCIGDNTVFDFIAYALHNPDLPNFDEINLDNVEMDWSWYKSGAKCQEAKKKTKGYPKTCIPRSYHFKEKGFLLAPKDFIDPNTGGVSASNHETKGKNNETKSDKKRKCGADCKMSHKFANAKHAKENKSKSVGV